MSITDRATGNGGSRSLLLDRDGIINTDHGYVGSVERFEWVDGIFDLTRHAFEQGWRIVVITNQSGIARGYFDENAFARLTTHMLDGFAARGVTLTAVMHCPFHRDGTVAAYARDSFWRKPNPGMILEAARRYRLDLQRSLFIGDTAGDMAAARAAGVGRRLLLAHGASAPSCPEATGYLARLTDALPLLNSETGPCPR